MYNLFVEYITFTTVLSVTASPSSGDFWVNVLIPGNDSQAGSLITRPSITGSIFTTPAVVT